MKDNFCTNEFRECLIKYCDRETSINTIDPPTDFANEFFNHFNKIIIRDNPDGYLKLDNRVIIIEHFEYDATKRNRKGSETRKEDSRINRKFIDLSTSTNEVSYIHDQMKVTHSTEYLRDNFIKEFRKHNSKINQYKQQLIKEGIISESSDTIIMFCCEDKTTFGCIGYDNGMYPFNIIDIKECLSVILESDVDYLLLCNPYQNDKYMSLLPVSNELLSISKNKMARDIEMIDFKPQVIGASIFIPSKRKQS